MPVTTAKAWFGNAYNNTDYRLLIELYKCLTTGDPSDHYHTVLDYDLVSPYTNFSSPWMLIRNPTAGYRIFLFTGTISSWSGIFALLDPSDTIEAPTVSTATPSAYASNYPLTSGFVNIYESSAGSFTGTLVHIAEYSDAILFATKAASYPYWQFAMHAGKIYVPFNASDPALGIDGYGILGGYPTLKDTNGGFTNQWVGKWNASIYTVHSRIKAGGSLWRATTIAVGSLGDSDDSSVAATDDLDGNVRMIPLVLQVMASDSSATASSAVGYTKYIRLYKGIGVHGSVINSADAGEDQAWFRFSGENGNSRSVILWSKTPVDGGTSTESGGSLNIGGTGTVSP